MTKLEKARTDPKQHWQTDPELFKSLHARYDFTVDGAANAHNALLPRYWDCFEKANWEDERVFINPPFILGDLAIRKAVEAYVRFRTLTVLLILGKTSCASVALAVSEGASIEVFSRRLQFVGGGGIPATSNNRESMLLVMDGLNETRVCPFEPPTPAQIRTRST